MKGIFLSAVGMLTSAASAESCGFDDGWERRWDDVSAWKRVTVPDDAMLDRPYVHDVALNDHGYKRGGILRYRKTFARPEAQADERLSLRFDGVYWDSTVYLNGVQVARRPHGWIGFEAPLADLRETNVVEVVCDVRTPCARWYTGAGLTRDVWLVRRRGYTLEPENVLLSLERVADGKAFVKVTVEGAEVVEPAGGRLEIAEPKWWSPDDPQLTEVRVTARDGQGRTDSRVFRWGLRTVCFTKDDGLHLNGRRVQIKGVCLHEGAPCVGNALCPELIEFQLAELKKIGVNAIRTAHNPMAPAFYDLCDRMGFLVMDEFFDEWMCTDAKSKCGYTRYFREWWKTDLEAQVRRDRNHPSIILWSIGNEIPELRDAPGAEPAAPWVKRLVEAVRAVDPTRPVTSACPAPSKSLRNGTMDLLDVVGMNYSPQDYPAVSGRYRLVASESAAAFSLRDAFPTNGFTGHVTGCHPSALCWGMPSEQALKLQRDNPWCAGEFVWSGFDYLGEGNHPVDNEIHDYWPARSSYWGIFDRAGLPKDVAYLYRSQWSREKTVHLLPNWEFPGREGRTIPVWCYTNAREAELFLNGRSLGVRRFADTDDLHLAWDVAYEPGVLEVRATFADGSVSTDRRETPGAFSGLRSTVLFERNGIRVVRVDAVDAKGRRVTTCDDEIELPLGGGVLLGADNGLPTDLTPFDAPRRRLFRGSLTVVVRSSASAAGEITIKEKRQ